MALGSDTACVLPGQCRRGGGKDALMNTDKSMELRKEDYLRPEMEVVALDEENVIVTSGCMVVSMSVSWSDGSGNRYTNTTPGF